ncbi:hypothetical protein Tco_1546805 [Tanacetum coccineum]
MRIEESLNVTFDESLPEPKSSSLVEDDRIIELVVHNPVRSSSLQVNASESGYPKSLKEAKGHPIEQVIESSHLLQDLSRANGTPSEQDAQICQKITADFRGLKLLEGFFPKLSSNSLQNSKKSNFSGSHSSSS